MNDNTSCELDLFADDLTAHTIRNTIDEVFIDLQVSINDLTRPYKQMRDLGHYQESIHRSITCHHTLRQPNKSGTAL